MPEVFKVTGLSRWKYSCERKALLQTTVGLPRSRVMLTFVTLKFGCLEHTIHNESARAILHRDALRQVTRIHTGGSVPPLLRMGYVNCHDASEPSCAF